MTSPLSHEYNAPRYERTISRALDVPQAPTTAPPGHGTIPNVNIKETVPRTALQVYNSYSMLPFFCYAFDIRDSSGHPKPNHYHNRDTNTAIWWSETISSTSFSSSLKNTQSRYWLVSRTGSITALVSFMSWFLLSLTRTLPITRWNLSLRIVPWCKCSSTATSGVMAVSSFSPWLLLSQWWSIWDVCSTRETGIWSASHA